MQKSNQTINKVKKVWGKGNPKFLDDTDVNLFSITNANNMTLKLSDLGASIISCILPNGQDVIVGEKASKYFPQYPPSAPYFGATIGRLASRSKTSGFVWNDREYFLQANANNNVHIHGGVDSFSRKIWNSQFIESAVSSGLRFYYHSPHLEEGYPGTIDVTVSITLYKSENIINIEYQANSDREAPLNLTNHSYFNLGGQNILDHTIQILADKIFILSNNDADKGQNTGELLDIKDTPLDLHNPKIISSVISDLKETSTGIDHIWQTSNTVNTSPTPNDLKLVAVLESPNGTIMETHTTSSALVCYTGNSLGHYNTGSRKFNQHEAICLETQHAPGFLHTSTIPASIVIPNKNWRSHTQYKFLV